MRALTGWTVLCVEHYYRRLLWVTGMVSGQKSPTETVVHAEVRRQESGSGEWPELHCGHYLYPERSSARMQEASCQH